MTDDKNDEGVKGEILPDDAPPSPDPNNSNWLALISNYTERPDLFLAEVEKHDPGFTARMNKDAQDRAERTETARFKFSKAQAYAALALSLVAALALIYTIVTVAIGGGSFWPLIALGIIYAITQGGSLGFEKVVEAISTLVGKAPK